MGKVKTTKESAVPVFGRPGNGYKTTDGKHVGRGRTAQDSQKSYEKPVSKKKK